MTVRRPLIPKGAAGAALDDGFAQRASGEPGASTRWHWLALLSLPAILTVAVPDWMYNATGDIDTWVYHGFFRHLETYAATMFRGTYYGTRLGWIIPGYVSYHVFEPDTARVILHTVFYQTAVLSLYVTVRHISGASSALFAAVVFGLYLPAIRALGSDYVDGAVITYCLLTMALALGGIQRTSPWMIFGSGVAAGAMLHSNVGAVLVLPSILVWFAPHGLVGWRSKTSIVQVAAWGAGIVTCTVVLGVVSVATGGDWAFFVPSITWLIAQGGTNPSDVSGFSWIARAPWVFLPVSVLIGSLVVWLQPRRREQLTGGSRRAIGALGVCVAIFAAFDYVGPGALLATSYYATWLLPWSFIAIGAVLSGPARSGRLDASIALACAGAMVLSLMRPTLATLPFIGIAGLVFTIALLGFAGWLRRVAPRRLTILAALVFMHGWLSTTEYGPSFDRADAFQAINNGIAITDRYISEARPLFLLAPLPKLGNYVRSFTSVYLWGYTILTDKFPSVTPGEARQIRAGTRVVVIAEHPNAAAPFDELLAPYGISGRILGDERLMTRHGLIHLTFLEAIEI